MSEGRLQALAKMMRSGPTPQPSTAVISASDAQSKQAPEAASTSSSAGSPLHLPKGETLCEAAILQYQHLCSTLTVLNISKLSTPDSGTMNSTDRKLVAVRRLDTTAVCCAIR